MPCGSASFPGSDPAPAERADVLRLAVVLVHERRAVAVADVDVAVGRDGDIGRVVAFRRPVRPGTVRLGVRRPLNLPDDLPLRRRLDHDRLHLGLRRHLRIRGIHRQVQELVAAFRADVQAVGDPAELLAPRSDELSLLVEDDHRVRAVARRVDRVMDVDVPLRVLDDAVRVPPLDAGGQLAPVVEGLVHVRAGAEHGRLRPRLVLRAEEDRGQDRSRGGRGEEFTACGFHLFLLPRAKRAGPYANRVQDRYDPCRHS